ncbi:MAG: hypothetical protein CH6_3127 [Candidatus Kapaibacterium sp.]|nr:MAG: hypothetical protein CH6_3127 [Candidatus Kapabacteria bacterium]
MKNILIVIVLVVAILRIYAQPDFEVNYLNDYRKSFTVQPIFFPTIESDSIDLVIPFKFTLNYLTFELASDNDQLFANFLVDFVLRDENGIIKKTFTFKDTLFVPIWQKDKLNIRNYLNYIQVRLPSQNYQLEVTLFDKEKTKQKSVKVDLKVAKIDNAQVFYPIFASRAFKETNKYALSLMNNALDYSKKDKVIILPILSKEGKENFTFKVKSNPIKTLQMNWQKDIEFISQPILLSSAPLKISKDSDNIFIDVEQKAFAATKSHLNFYLIEFPENMAYLQDYILTIQAEKSNDTVSINFKINWGNPPLSLRNVNYAIELMYYILDDEKFNFLVGLKRMQQWQEFFETWRKFDTDTTTMFNEAMEEYYKRVDFAYLNFQTVAEPDGAKTERGKIFILYGKPSDIQRIVDKDGVVTEHWIYYRLKKKFTFVTKYRKFELVEINDL